MLGVTISGLVITLETTSACAHAVVAQLRSDPRLTVGALHATRLPVVAETADAADGAALVRTLERLPAVARVDVITIHFDDDTDDEADDEVNGEVDGDDTRPEVCDGAP